MESHYITVYQISTDPSLSPFATPIKAGPLVLAIIGFAFAFFVYVYWKKKTHQSRERFSWFVLISCCIFACFLCICACLLIFFHNLDRRSQDANTKALQALSKGDYQTVEGRISNFDPMPYEGHKNECFSVQDKRFCHSDYFIAPGFRNTTSHGGPIRPGLKVQIAYISAARHNTILRLKIAQE
jgi:hypothetical protein